MKKYLLYLIPFFLTFTLCEVQASNGLPVEADTLVALPSIDPIKLLPIRTTTLESPKLYEAGLERQVQEAKLKAYLELDPTWPFAYAPYTTVGMAMDSIPCDTLNSDLLGDNVEVLNQAICQAKYVVGKLKEAGNYVQQLNEQSFTTFPVGLSQELGGVTVTVGISTMKLLPTHAQLTVFMEIEGGNLEAPLYFGSPDVKFTRNGGIVGGASLALLGNFPIDLFNDKIRLIFKQAGILGDGTLVDGTYVSFDCDGFVEMSLEADIEFSREILKPADAIDSTSTEKVTASFGTVASSLEDILIEVTIEDFVATKAEDVVWEVDNVVFDFSDTRNSDNFTFPPDYEPSLPGNLWKGFYMESLVVLIPERLTGGQDIEIGATDIIIDDKGFTGYAYAAPTEPLFEGSLEGWAFSLDRFEVGFKYSNLETVAFNGKVNVPIVNSDDTGTGAPAEEDYLLYDAFIAPGSFYSFTVTTTSQYNVNMWKAKMNLEPNSSIELTYDNDVFTATAILHGGIEIDGDFTNNFNVNIPSIGFDSLRVSNQAPYFSPGDWSFPDELGANIGSFEITISNIAINSYTEAGEDRAGVDFDLSLTLDGAVSIEAAGGFHVDGRFDQSGSYHRWRPESFSVDSIFISGSFAGVDSMSALLVFFDEDDENGDYGHGFRGQAYVKFKSLGAASAIAQFGTKEGQKYFLVDALLEFSDASSIKLGGLEIKGFGGGIYKRMSRENDIDQAMAALMENNNTGLGRGLTGMKYNVDPTTYFGFKATVLLSTTASDAFNASVTLGMEFGETNGTGSFGLTKLWLQGVGKFMAPIDIDQVPGAGPGLAALNSAANTPVIGDALNLDDNPFVGSSPPTISAEVTAYALFDFNFNEKEFNARLQVFVSAAGILEGQAWAAAYLNMQNNEWWLFIGSPENRNTFTLDLILLEVELTNYFAIGSLDIPPVPDPYLPGFEDELSGLTYDGSRAGNLTTGSGMVFGASFFYDTGEQRFLFFYGQFSGGFGFDIGLRKLAGECNGANIEDLVGINGWYATGQAYAGFHAVIGAKIKIFGISKSIEIISAKVAAGLKMELPNPFWAKVLVSAELSVLGIIEVDADFTFEIGETLDSAIPQCDIEEGNPLADIEVIDVMYIKDFEGTVDVPVTAGIATDFFIKPNHLLTLYNDETEENETYRVYFSSFSIKQSNGDDISIGGYGGVDWLNNGKTYLRTYLNFLPSQTEIVATTRVKFQKLVSGTVLPNGEVENADWDFVEDEETGEHLIEEKTLTFTTGNRPWEISHDNIRYAYPIPGMTHFHIEESTNKLYLYLKANQIYLENDLPAGYTLIGRLANANNNSVVEDNLEVSFYHPYLGNTYFDDEEEYPGSKIFIDYPTLMQVSSDYTLSIFAVGDGSDPDLGDEAEVIRIPFSTSMYPTFAEKIATFNQSSDTYHDGGNEFAEDDWLEVQYTVPEGFDEIEMNGWGGYDKPLVRFNWEITKEVNADSTELEVSDPLWLVWEADEIVESYPYFGGCDLNMWLPDKAIDAFHPNGNQNVLDIHFNAPKIMYNQYLGVMAWLSWNPEVNCVGDWTNMMLDNSLENVKGLCSNEIELIPSNNLDLNFTGPSPTNLVFEQTQAFLKKEAEAVPGGCGTSWINEHWCTYGFTNPAEHLLPHDLYNTAEWGDLGGLYKLNIRYFKASEGAILDMRNNGN